MKAKPTSILTPPARLLYPQAEAAVLLGVSLRTVVSLIASGELKTRLVGARRLIPGDELRRFASVDHPLPAAEPAATPKKSSRTKGSVS